MKSENDWSPQNGDPLPTGMKALQPVASSSPSVRVKLLRVQSVRVRLSRTSVTYGS
jgi:hypothetical protein